MSGPDFRYHDTSRMTDRLRALERRTPPTGELVPIGVIASRLIKEILERSKPE